MASSTLDDNVLALLEDARNEGLSLASLQARLSRAYTADEVAHAADTVGIRLLIGKEERFVERGRVQDVASDISEMIEAYHQAHPIAFGPSLAFFEGQLKGQRSRLAAAALAVLEEDGEIVRDGAVVRRANFEPATAPVERVYSIYREGKLTPPTDDEAIRDAGLSPEEFADALGELKRQDRLARVGDLHFDTSILIEVGKQVVRHFGSSETLSTGEFKEVAGGVSRKFAIPLLEWLDKEGVTKRQGDTRVPGSHCDSPRFAPSSR